MMKNVVTAICSVQFHLTEGQKVESIYPEHALNEAEITAVGYSCFPDSMSFELTTRNSIRDTSFSFRIPRLPSDTSATVSFPRQNAPITEFLHGFVFCRQRQDEKLQRGGEQRAIVVLSSLPLSNLFKPLSQYAGPLCLAQGPGALRAVYEEVATWSPLLEWGSSVDLPLGHAVLRVDLPDLSSLPLDSAHAVAQLTGASSAAEAFAEELDLDTGCPMCLLPRAKGQQAPAAGLFTDADIFTPFAGQMKNMWTLWEILLLGEPLLVASPTPLACSAACAALASLLAPLPYSADYRPYFTIHDPAFRPFASGAMPNTSITNTSSLNGRNKEQKTATAASKMEISLPSLLGVTNPFIIKSLAHWPNVLSTGYTPLTTGGEESNSTSVTGSTKTSGGSARNHQSGTRPHSSNANYTGSGHGSDDGKRNASSGVFGYILRRPSLPEIIRGRVTGSHSNTKALPLLNENPTDTAWLNYRSLLQPDPEILNSIVIPETGDGVPRRRRLARMNSMILRRHFEELGRAVVFPLLPYITPAPPPTLPSTAAVSLAFYSSPPPLPELDIGELILNIASGVVNIPEILVKRCGNGNRKILAEFYKRLLTESTAMATWLHARRAAASAYQAATWRNAWRQAGGAFRLPGIMHTEDVGSIEDFLHAEAEVKRAAAAVPDSGAITDNNLLFNKLLEELRLKFDVLPTDLQDSLLMNPERKSFLGM
ncbi:putative Protein DENND6A [Nannochloris sp. 'desiccata']|nr:putative Protein DENND6A [Chlorella desiccata (nom. nud.)]